jgi:maltooligosyltrehalose trehalohydrolase
MTGSHDGPEEEMRRLVWAPRATAVALVTGAAREQLVALGDGFFGLLQRTADALLVPGARYGFSLDGAEAVPDPRSRSQPDGVHALSEVIDPAFPWTDAGFVARPLSSAIVYELHIGTFSPEGTFDGAAARLEHLVELGVTHVEVMPVAEFSGLWGWGYDGVDLFAPHRAYGGPAAMRRFVDACHARGIAVLLDVVYNHLGPTGNYLGRYGPYFSAKHRTPWGEAINFYDRGSDEVRRFFLDNARMWMEDYHVDGLRLDAVHAIVDGSALPITEELAAETAALGARLGKPLVLIAESDLNDPRVIRSRDAGGLGFDAQWSDDFHHALHATLTGERDGYYADFGGLGCLERALTRGWVYEGQHAPSRGRRHGRALGGLSGHRLFGYLQTHDQVGNRARGERIAALAGLEGAKVGLALVLCSPFVPMLFAGEEWGALTPFQFFTNHEEEALAESVRQGRRREFASFGWDPASIPDPQDRATFLRSKLDWSEPRRAPHDEVLRFTRALIQLRRDRAALSDGNLERVRCRVAKNGWLVLERGELCVLANMGEAGFSTLRELGHKQGRALLASQAGVTIDGDVVRMPPRSAVVVEVPEIRA